MSKRKPKTVIEIISSDDDEVEIVSVVKKARVEEDPPKYLHKDDERYVKEMSSKCDFFGYCDFGKASPAHRFIKISSQMLPKAVNAVGREIAQVSSRDCIQETLLTQSSAIIIRADLERPHLMRLVLTGPSDSPYQNGVFLFDVAFPNNYPQTPPQVQLLTTGHGSVRFGPNLYNCGKVCLSLLNTWQGPGWDPKRSNLKEVLFAIQASIMNEYPFYNEPGFGSPSAALLNMDRRLSSSWQSKILGLQHYEKQHTIDLTVANPIIAAPEEKLLTASSTYYETKNNARHDQQARQYNYVVRANCLKWAMVHQLQNPPSDFGKEIRLHFQLKASEIFCPQQESWMHGQGNAYVQNLFPQLESLMKDKGLM